MSSGLNPALALAAGALTILSPCVLPLVPIVIGSAGQRSKWGPLALALGLVASFTLVGFAVAVLGAASGFDGEIIRQVGAVVLLLAGVVLLVPKAADLLTRLATPLATWANRRQSGLERFAWPGKPRSASCSGWCGVLASAPRLAPQRYLRRKDEIWEKSR